MTSLLKKVAGAFSFAHLAGKPAAAEPTPADDDGRKKRDDETDDEYASRCKAMDDDAKAVSDKEDPSPANDDKDDDVKAKAARAQGHAAGRTAERERCAAIFASPGAVANVPLAAELAFNSELPAAQVAAILGKSPAHANAPGNPTRAARNPNVGTGAVASVAPERAIADRWDKVLQSTAPKRRA